jgi:hypothetical protein
VGKITGVAQELLASHEMPCSMKCDRTVEKRLRDGQSIQNLAYRNVRYLLFVTDLSTDGVRQEGTFSAFTNIIVMPPSPSTLTVTAIGTCLCFQVLCHALTS